MMSSASAAKPGSTKPVLRPEAFHAIRLPSNSTTDQPRRAISRAAVRPASPPPTTQASTSHSTVSGGRAGLATALTGALALFPAYGHVGVAMAIAISGWVGASLLCAVLTRRRWIAGERNLARRLLGIVLATAVMGLRSEERRVGKECRL